MSIAELKAYLIMPDELVSWLQKKPNCEKEIKKYIKRVDSKEEETREMV